jgi:hypothetical protein
MLYMKLLWVKVRQGNILIRVNVLLLVWIHMLLNKGNNLSCVRNMSNMCYGGLADELGIVN